MWIQDGLPCQVPARKEVPNLATRALLSFLLPAFVMGMAGRWEGARQRLGRKPITVAASPKKSHHLTPNS